MHLWTIQRKEVWDLLQAEGTLFVPPRKWTPPSYVWIQGQFRERVAGYQGNLPWWAHCKKPRLSLHRDSYHYREKFVRLELVVPDKRVLSFPCWAWDRVFCQDYLAVTKREYENWETTLAAAGVTEDDYPLPQPWQNKMRKSWLRLFDPNLPRTTWDSDGFWKASTCREAVFESLNLKQVRSVAVARGKSQRTYSTLYKGQ
ncbi:MAG: DUF3841 domain-containing protein [Pirellulales bacterium]|nr:DUF3841 domain-containing protein [Pirellulales bacterium]